MVMIHCIIAYFETEIHEDYVHPDLIFSSGQKIQLDIYLPRHLLAFEYHGEQHFNNAYNFGPQWIYQERDEHKRLACKEKGITLIEIPFWWDFQKESLAATIHKYREGLITTISNSATPIPEKPPK